jgi:hypothetical protein
MEAAVLCKGTNNICITVRMTLLLLAGPTAAATPNTNIAIYLCNGGWILQNIRPPAFRYLGPLAKQYVAAAYCVVPGALGPESQSFGVKDRPKALSRCLVDSLRGKRD